MIINSNYDFNLNYTQRKTVFQKDSSSTCPVSKINSFENKKSCEAMSSYGRYLTFKGTQENSNCDFLSRIPKNHAPLEIDIKKIEKELKNGGVPYDHNPYSFYNCDKIGKMRDNGQFLSREMTDYGAQYRIETPGDNPYGYSDVAIYNSFGDLKTESWVVTNSDGTYDKFHTEYKNGKPHSFKKEHGFNDKVFSLEYVNEGSYTKNEYYYTKGKVSKVVTHKTTPSGSLTITSFKGENFVTIVEPSGMDNTDNGVHDPIYAVFYPDGSATLNDKELPKEDILEKINFEELNNREYDSLETLCQRIPDGYYYNQNLGKLVKVEKDDLFVIEKEKGSSEYLMAIDYTGTVVGIIGYENKGDDLYFKDYATGVSGINLGTGLLNTILYLAEQSNKGLVGVAQFKASSLWGTQKQATNMGFYYKMGFRAQDEGTDKLVQECIDRGFEIPTTLNDRTPIRYVGKGAPVGSGAHQISVRDIKTEDK